MMNTMLNFFRLITAGLIPLSAVIFSVITLRQVGHDNPSDNEDRQTCQRCGQMRQGAAGEFTYAKSMGSPRQRIKNKAPLMPEPTALGSESHFICDRCASEYLYTEMFFQTLMALAYPVYLLVIIPVFQNNGQSANVLVEAFLVVLTLAGTASAYDLYRAVRTGDTSLAEARDRVAIRTRKPTLGKDFSYFTRIGMRYLKKSRRSSGQH